MAWRPSAALFWMIAVAMCSSLMLGFIFVFPTGESIEEWRHHEGHRSHHHQHHQQHEQGHGAADGNEHGEERHGHALNVGMKKWQGLDAPTSGMWDFFGLNINMDKKATPYPGQLIADYDISKVDAANAPKEYNLPQNPAFKYPDPLDPLFVTISTTPRLLYFPRIATDEELDHVISQAEPHMARSLVALTKGSKGQSATQEVRTSHSTWVNLHGKLSMLEKRLTTITGISWHEPMNVLRYGLTQHYDSHHDYFDPNMYGPQASNRMGTFFIYLNDTDAGGATTVPRANGGAMPRNYKAASCKQGVQVLPRKGSAILLYDMRPDRSLDPYSLHGGCDVLAGTKWGGVVWFRTSTKA
eukprot:TRINITY_DN2614_c0_g1_i2.p1 TRINITY_DN2614_c0_g1~~TRINITY_DN2614_c0_g1_i2.p1  ORF type:complete len:356 (+),score=110.68 TRINITY_DN2614_c0_g1_i2:113-1180(+)